MQFSGRRTSDVLCVSVGLYISFHVASQVSTSYPPLYLLLFIIINAVIHLLLLIVEALLNEQQTLIWFYLKTIRLDVDPGLSQDWKSWSGSWQS